MFHGRPRALHGASHYNLINLNRLVHGEEYSRVVFGSAYWAEEFMRNYVGNARWVSDL